MSTTDPAASIQGLLELARARAQAGDVAGAARTWEAAIHLADEHGLPGPEVGARLAMAERAVKQGQIDEALAQLTAAWERVEGAGGADAAEVQGRRGQVLVFQGELGAGIVEMRAAAARWESLGIKDRATELDLAAQAVEARVDKAVEEATTDEGRARSLRMRARLRRALGAAAAAEADLHGAWELSGVPARLRAGIGSELGALLLEHGQVDRARAVLAATRALADSDQNDVVDALLARAGGASA
jgi:tetratricopeptide (TPR) repeat protein